MKHLKGDEYNAYSAGTSPHGIDPIAVNIMAEVGIDISDSKANTINDFVDDVKFDIAVTVCSNAQENCPIFPDPSTKVIHRSFDDPPHLSSSADSEDEILDIYRRVRDQIKDFILENF